MGSKNGVRIVLRERFKEKRTSISAKNLLILRPFEKEDDYYSFMLLAGPT